MQMLFSLKGSEASSPVWYRYTLLIMYVLYVLGGPFMIMNMWGNRKSSFKKRNAGKAPPRPVSGLQWPVTNTKTNERSSSKTNKTILSVAVGAADQSAKEKLDKVKVRLWCLIFLSRLLIPSSCLAMSCLCLCLCRCLI